jgi:DNA replication protein DnaC
MKDTELRDRAKKLQLHGLFEHISEVEDQAWVKQLLEWEESTRQRRSFERRVTQARLGRFKDMADFDWCWPSKIDREQFDELMTLDWVDEGRNLIVLGPNSVGKTMMSKNLAHRSLLRGHSVLFATASEILNDLSSRETSSSLLQRLRKYVQPDLLCIDELGYLSYDHRHADLLFEVVTRRYEEKSILITTNKSFSEWNTVFPNATCVVTLVDRLVHHADIMPIEGKSYRLKEAQENTSTRAKSRASKRSTTSASASVL